MDAVLVEDLADLEHGRHVVLAALDEDVDRGDDLGLGQLPAVELHRTAVSDAVRRHTSRAVLTSWTETTPWICLIESRRSSSEMLLGVAWRRM